ncbi:KUP/HAK/KT family potassium transporter [uncultured Limosilactobacillus sp.]|uniref:KUP/HAK/KT family potassium transporter n=1 Tax=uncultured Limosilactobacillus sp. TaxID=2837629 RepID=UPI0025F3AE3B|nr:KUP/HAK/KT family potassium transporter [uncultured Limosilactobacillus sp.]
MENKNLGLLASGLVALGIVYGDIGTSPLYVMNALINDAGGTQALTENYIIGGVSLVFWTLMLMTTVKYVLIALRADNNGEGGIFALYALVRHQARWLIVPALIGGAALLADGTLTPAVTVTTAIEGLKGINLGSSVLVHNQTEVVWITFGILLILFMVQRFGTSAIGKTFGPLMLIWFLFLAIFGVANLVQQPMILKALSPVYGVRLLFSPANHDGIFILGAVFLATTGAEALYSDMGHVGRNSIYLTWPLVCGSLVLNYLGQGSFLLNHLGKLGEQGNGYNPFYQMLPGHVYLFGVAIATIAAIIASQALITGSFTLVEEAIGLKLLPRLKVRHPSLSRGQIYISPINWLLCVITSAILFYFQTSAHMEAAYGLAITITMLMTTLILHQYLMNRWSSFFATLFLVVFATIETVFLLSSLTKFVHGGFVTVIITFLILMVMVCWYYGDQVRDEMNDESKYLNLEDYKDQLQRLSADQTMPLYVSNLIMMARINKNHQLKRETLYSILDKSPKRAKVYWFITVNTTDDPYTSYYKVDMMGTRNVVNLQLYLGFKIDSSVNLYLRQVVQELMAENVIDQQPQKYTTTPGRKVGDFRFIFLKERLSPNSEITGFQRLLVQTRLLLQNLTLSPVQYYGLEFSQTYEETVPLFINNRHGTTLDQRQVKNYVK